MARTVTTFACTDCRRKMRGSPGDDTSKCCESCGGQLRRVRYGPARKRRPR